MNKNNNDAEGSHARIFSFQLMLRAYFLLFITITFISSQ